MTTDISRILSFCQPHQVPCYSYSYQNYPPHFCQSIYDKSSNDANIPVSMQYSLRNYIKQPIPFQSIQSVIEIPCHETIHLYKRLTTTSTKKKTYLIYHHVLYECFRQSTLHSFKEEKEPIHIDVLIRTPSHQMYQIQWKPEEYIQYVYPVLSSWNDDTYTTYQLNLDNSSEQNILYELCCLKKMD